jgi:two-component system sensor histidine kinase KdpD
MEAGVRDPADVVPSVRHKIRAGCILELYGVKPSAEVQSALVNLVRLVLERAAVAEENSRIESERRADELRTTVFESLAHSFKTPLTSIKAAASTIRADREISPESAMDLIGAIDEEADRLIDLIQDSLSVARIQARLSHPHTDHCELNAIVSAAIGRISTHLGRGAIDLQLPGDLPDVSGDSWLFEQMILQVLDNARKYGRPGGQIWISASQLEQEVELTIENEGSPIPDEEQKLVFGRFYRGERTRALVEGTGLGLPIARTIAEAHGGRLLLMNGARGPAFRFVFPVTGMVPGAG